ncbi:hypothetical protein [Streptosporangium vulgare]|uniref:hypothetical protein n=1 Tax=Streptosporangium vulgare TaxID=46190 RepID=UPI0031D59B7C
MSDCAGRSCQHLGRRHALDASVSPPAERAPHLPEWVAPQGLIVPGHPDLTEALARRLGSTPTPPARLNK